MSITWIDRGLARQHASSGLEPLLQAHRLEAAKGQWVLILAAGAGTRLHGLARSRNGVAVPKQYCSLAGGASLLEETIERALAVTESERIVVIVAAEHRPFWANGLPGIPDENLIIQPANRGTAFGIALGMAVIHGHDAEAAVVTLPSDHYVGDEEVLRQAVAKGFARLEPESRVVRFLGMRPESVDPELGYIVRGELLPNGNFRIARFVEKPSYTQAAELLARSALWNSFILVGRANAYLDLVAAQFPRQVTALRAAQRPTGSSEARMAKLESLYARLPVADFSRDVVARVQAPLEVIPVGACAWSDLGTPERVAECLTRVGRRSSMQLTTHLCLAEAQLRYAQATL